MPFAFFPGARLGAEEVTAATDYHPGVDAVAVARPTALEAAPRVASAATVPAASAAVRQGL